MDLIIKARSIYGQVRYYVDGDLADPISRLTGQEALSFGRKKHRKQSKDRHRSTDPGFTGHRI